AAHGGEHVEPRNDRRIGHAEKPPAAESRLVLAEAVAGLRELRVSAGAIRRGTGVEDEADRLGTQMLDRLQQRRAVTGAAAVDHDDTIGTVLHDDVLAVHIDHGDPCANGTTSTPSTMCAGVVPIGMLRAAEPSISAASASAVVPHSAATSTP